jgi:hypothetical protein
MAHNEEDVLKIIFVLELHATSYHSVMKAGVREALDAAVARNAALRTH